VSHIYGTPTHHHAQEKRLNTVDPIKNSDAEILQWKRVCLLVTGLDRLLVGIIVSNSWSNTI